MNRKTTYGLWLFLIPVFLWGQQVSYSSYIHLRQPGNFRVIGKAGNFYWIEKEELKKIYGRRESSLMPDSRLFAVFDNRLNLIREIPAQEMPGTVREYLINGQFFFDQMILVASPGKTNVVINRYPVFDNMPVKTKQVDSLPFSATGTRFLLLRSEDHTKTLLLAFESRPDASPRIHTILFDQGWNILYHQTLEHAYFNQPCIQDDAVSFPAESFDNLPVKLANNGAWLMASTSIINLNYLLFHFDADGKHFSYQEIPLSPYYNVEDIALSIDNEKQEIGIGLLSRYHNTSFKNVQISHYSMTKNLFDFDSAYRFNSLTGRLRNQNLSNESFVAVPGQGFMLFKEYGRMEDNRNAIAPEIAPWDPVYLLAGFSGGSEGPLHKDSYTLQRGLRSIRTTFDRGNLTMFYCPLKRADSTWSGMINTEQSTELNSPSLSYLVFPVRDKVYIIYNSPARSPDTFSTTTTLDTKGQETGDPVIFWKMDGQLDYQRARRISSDEVAVPYRGNGEAGFAVIRL